MSSEALESGVRNISPTNNHALEVIIPFNTDLRRRIEAVIRKKLPKESAKKPARVPAIEKNGQYIIPFGVASMRNVTDLKVPVDIVDEVEDAVLEALPDRFGVAVSIAEGTFTIIPVESEDPHQAIGYA